MHYCISRHDNHCQDYSLACRKWACRRCISNKAGQQLRDWMSWILTEIAAYHAGVNTAADLPVLQMLTCLQLHEGSFAGTLVGEVRFNASLAILRYAGEP